MDEGKNQEGEKKGPGIVWGDGRDRQIWKLRQNDQMKSIHGHCFISSLCLSLSLSLTHTHSRLLFQVF